MIYDYRAYTDDVSLNKRIDKKMNAAVNGFRTSYMYKQMAEDFIGGRNKLYDLLELVSKGDTVYLYDVSFLGDNDDEAFQNMNLFFDAGVEIVECKGTDELPKNTQPVSVEEVADETIDAQEETEVKSDETSKTTAEKVQDAHLIETDDTCSDKAEAKKVEDDRIYAASEIKTTKAFQWVKRKYEVGASKQQMIDGFNSLHNFNPKVYSVNDNDCMTEEVLDSWLKIINPEHQLMSIEEEMIATEGVKGPVMEHQVWCDTSEAAKWIYDRISEGMLGGDIMQEFNILHKGYPDIYSTWKGGELSFSELSVCRKDVNI